MKIVLTTDYRWLWQLVFCLMIVTSFGQTFAQEATPEVTVEITPTDIPTATFSPTPTITPTWTSVVVTTVVTQPVVVTQPPIVITQPPVVITMPPVVVTIPPVIITRQVIVPVVSTSVPLATTRNSNPPSNEFGWQRYESIEFIPVVGVWQLRTAQNASDGAYHETDRQEAVFRFPFEGDGIRLGFRLQRNGGSFHLRVDNHTLDIFDTQFPDSDTTKRSVITREYFFDAGYHVMDIFVSTLPEYGQVAVDFVEIFNGPPVPHATIDSPAGMRDALDIQLVDAPPTPTSTPAPLTASVITVDVIIAYDLNANGEIDPNEGAQNISIRAVDTLTNALLASNVTDASGFARVQVTTTHDLLLVIPLLGETFEVRNRGREIVTSWTLLISPANVPGLIP
jgi:hypothetical protein